MSERLDADYVVIGAGAMSMAFVDVILDEDPRARVIMIDRRAMAGGHWNDAYPYVRLHQPAMFYGLHTTPLGTGGADLVSGPEIVAYYGRAMDRFVASGRVRFLSMCDYQGKGRVVSLLDPEHTYDVVARRRVVDGSYLEARVPATHAPSYDVAAGVELTTPNGLARLRSTYDEYVVAGAGKTATDAILFLLKNGVPPRRVTWISPHDSWLWDRSTVQAGDALPAIRLLLEHAVKAPDTDTAFLELERKGITLRIDTGRMPTKWRCATIERSEVEQLRQVENVVRLGRIRRVEPGQIELDDGSITIADHSLVVDCTANGLASSSTTPIWGPGSLTLQAIFMCQQTTSAALIGRVELLDITDERRNHLLKPVPHPEWADDLRTVMPLSVRNILTVTRALPLWLRRSRVYLGAHETWPTYLAEAGRMAYALRRHAS